MDYDTYLFDLYIRLGDITKDSFSSFISNADITYSNLNSSFNNVSDLITGAKWDDDVKTKIEMNIEPIKKLIAQCESYSKDVIIPLSTEVEVLGEKLKKYFGIISGEKDKKTKYSRENIDDYTTLQQFYNRYNEWIDNPMLFRKLINKFYQLKSADLSSIGAVANGVDESMVYSRIMMIYSEIQSYYHGVMSDLESRHADRYGSRYADRYGSKYADRYGSRYADRYGSRYADRYGSRYADRYGSRYADRSMDYMRYQRINNNYFDDFNNHYSNSLDYDKYMRTRMMRESHLGMYGSKYDTYGRYYDESFSEYSEEKNQFKRYLKNRIEMYFRPKDEYSSETIYTNEYVEDSLNANTLAKECYESIQKINKLLGDEYDIGRISSRIAYYNSKIKVMETKAQKYALKSSYKFGGSGSSVVKATSTAGVAAGAISMGVASSSSTGWAKENGKWVYNQDGKKTTGWKEISWDGGKDWFYFNGNGEMQTGWQEISWNGKNTWFYFDPTNGNMMKNTTVTIDGKSYKFDSNGAWVE